MQLADIKLEYLRSMKSHANAGFKESQVWLDDYRRYEQWFEDTRKCSAGRVSSLTGNKCERPLKFPLEPEEVRHERQQIKRSIADQTKQLTSFQKFAATLGDEMIKWTTYRDATRELYKWWEADIYPAEQDKFLVNRWCTAIDIAMGGANTSVCATRGGTKL